MNSQCVLCLDRLVNVTGWYLPFYYHRPIVNVSLAVNLINLQNHLLFCLVDRVLWFFFFLNLNFNWKQITERKYFIYWCHNICFVVYSFYLQHCKNIRIECSDQNVVYIYTSVGKLLSAPPPKKKKDYRIKNRKDKFTKVYEYIILMLYKWHLWKSIKFLLREEVATPSMFESTHRVIRNWIWVLGIDINIRIPSKGIIKLKTSMGMVGARPKTWKNKKHIYK